MYSTRIVTLAAQESANMSPRAFGNGDIPRWYPRTEGCVADLVLFPIVATPCHMARGKG